MDLICLNVQKGHIGQRNQISHISQVGYIGKMGLIGQKGSLGRGIVHVIGLIFIIVDFTAI